MRSFLILTIFISYSFASIAGIVYDKSTNLPIKNAIIIANNLEYKTDTNGTFNIKNASTVGIRAIGYDRKFYVTSGKMYLNPLTPKILYLSSFGATNDKIMGNAKELIKTTKLNGVVIDIKMDRGQIAFKVQNIIANKIGAQQLILFKDMKKFVNDLKKQGIYTIARIVTFKDTPYITAHPEYSVKQINGALFKDKEGLYWIDASIKNSWEYPISIAEETAKMGFDEIQFDYIRFPDRKGIVFSVPNTEIERVKAISGFLKTARERLTKYNVFISADIFGYASWHNGDIEIGQRIDAMAPFVDYMSPMLYPSGFHNGIPNHKNPVIANYEIVKQSLDKALLKSKGSTLAYRPWLQAFRDYAFDRRIYGDKEIREQIQASDDFGSNGWILWNPRNVYTKAGL